MALTPQEMDQLMDEHFGYEARDDVDGVMGTLAADYEHDIVGWPTGPTSKPADTRAFYERMFSDIAEGESKTLRRIYGDNLLIDESLWSGKAVGQPFGLEGGGKAVSFRLLHIMEFTEAKKISREQVWLDVASLKAQLEQG